MELEKAYRNTRFLESPAARPLRILAEYLEPDHRLGHYRIENTIVFFGSARILPRDVAQQRLDNLQRRRPDSSAVRRAERALELSAYYEDARELARQLTIWSKEEIRDSDERFYVSTGGGPGIMEAANRGASEAGGRSVGLNISLPMEQQPNPWQTRELAFDFHYFFMRKFWFFYLAKAMVVMPGGFGTFDELFELMTLVQTQKTRKPLPIVLYGSAFWREAVNLELLADWGLISDEDLSLFRICDTVEEAFTYLTEQISLHYLSDRMPSDHDHQ
ncbi:MAG: TIGR00730 family Rossman fold protein [Candidatus Dadabacteria bacterium]|nr:MAG: TIGR00730 family Rossman fold protein [Candidatus Dadabacteria bacterium]